MSLRSFTSVEAMLDAIEKDQVEADNAVGSWQATLGPGEYFIRVGPDDVAIYCEVLDPSLPVVGKGPYDQEYLDELKESAAWYSEPHMRNFRFCRAYSIFCVGGELGDVHISTAVLKISKDNFEHARSCGWKSKVGS